MRKITLKILRSSPKAGEKPYYQTFTLEAEPTDRVLDLLEKIKGNQDGTLTFRRSCAHGICGSDAMRINGRNALACKILVKDLRTDRLLIEPLLGLKVIRDLVVDMELFFDHYRAMRPYLINDEPLPQDGRERTQLPRERALIDDTTNCILCAACTAACPPFWAKNEYVGPAAIVNGHRFLFDSRDRATEERLRILAEPNGVWRCRTAFNCTEACPREIKITRAIAEVKRAILRGTVRGAAQEPGSDIEGAG